MLKKLMFPGVIFTLILTLILSSCAKQDNSIADNSMISAGNIQNGGYVIKYFDNYLYANQDDYNNLYLRNVTDGTDKKLSGGHYFYDMNLYNNEIYYTSSYPGYVWKISPDGKSKKQLINQRVGNLILYNDHMYYRLSEDNDWGKLYLADLNGNNKQLLSDKVISFCIYDDLIYYMDTYNKNSLCSMNLDGSDINTINNSYANNVLAENDMLIYSDHNRDDKLYTYDLKTNIENCISEDKCWNINCNQDWIFYRNQSDGGSLYCIDFKGNIQHKLIEGNISDILVIDNDIFYRNIDKENKIEYLDLNSKIQ